MQQKDSAEMQQMQGQGPAMQGAEAPRHGSGDARASIAAPLVFLLAVGLSALGLLYLGARDLVLPMLFLSLPLATVWLIVNDHQNRD